MVKITIPDIPPSLNQFAGRKNHHEYRKVKDYWTDLVWVSALGNSKIEGKAKVQITYYFPCHRRRDPDNYSGKFMLDGLVKARVLEDDSFKFVELELIGAYDKENPRTEILVVAV